MRLHARITEFIQYGASLGVPATAFVYRILVRAHDMLCRLNGYRLDWLDYML
jgi:hypothetical protein